MIKLGHRQILSESEWYELMALRKAIADYPATVCPPKLERYTQLMVRTLHYSGLNDPAFHGPFCSFYR